MKKFLPLSLSLLLIAACQTNPEQYPEHKCNETEDNFIITEYNRKNEMCRVGKRNAMVLVENEM